MTLSSPCPVKLEFSGGFFVLKQQTANKEYICSSTVLLKIMSYTWFKQLTMYLFLPRALRAVDDLVQKIEFEGPVFRTSSKNLALGISAVNASEFNGTTFSAIIPPNTTEPEVPEHTQTFINVIKISMTLSMNPAKHYKNSH